MSENGSNSVGVDQDEDVPETLSDENNGMYHQMNLKDATNSNTNTRETTAPVEQAKSKIILKPESQSQLRSRFLSPTCNLKPADLDKDSANIKAIYHSPQM